MKAQNMFFIYKYIFSLLRRFCFAFLHLLPFSIVSQEDDDDDDNN